MLKDVGNSIVLTFADSDFASCQWENRVYTFMPEEGNLTKLD